MNRRDFLKSVASGSALIAGAPIVFAGAQNETILADENVISPNGIILERVELIYPELPTDLDGYTFSFITDFHLGGWLKDEVVLEALQLAQSHHSQALFLGGDLIWVPDYSVSKIDSFINPKYAGKDTEVAELVFNELSRMLTKFDFPDGKYTVLGNHDRWSNFEGYKVLEQTTALNSVLTNKTAVIRKGKASLEVFGSEDLWTGIPQLPKYSSDPGTFKILLTHNPDFASFVYHKAKIFFQLALCGHTHGGQIKLPVIGALHYNIRDLRYREGLVDYGNSKFYTARGIGCVEVPLRINCPPEVTIFTLKRSTTAGVIATPFSKL